jgi:hypothetical protein
MERNYSKKRMTLCILFAFTATTSTLLQWAQFTVYFGNMLDRITNYLIIDSSELLQAMPNGSGWWISYIFGAMIMLGPMDYYVLLGGGNMIGLVITLLGIYGVSAFWIGLNMRRYHPIGGFILGFVSIAFFNIIVYFFSTKLSVLFQGIDPEMTGMIQNLMNSILGGIYDDDISNVLFRGIIWNGIIFGVFGAFWTAVLMKPLQKEPEISIELICDAVEEICEIPEKYLNGDLL